MARFIVTRRDIYRVPHATSCRALGVSQAWFYKWRHVVRYGDASPRFARREQLKIAIGQWFAKHHGTYGSPRITADLRDEGWRVSENTVAQLMRELGLRARRKRRRNQTTRPGRGRWRAPDLIRRDFGASQLNRKWYGDGTEILTAEGKLFLDSVLDMASRRIVGFSLGEHHNTELAYDALVMAVAVRGGKDAITGVVMHTDQGSEYTAGTVRAACTRLGITQSMGRPGSALDNAVIDSWHSTVESNCAGSSTSPPRHTPAPGSRPGSRTTTTTGATPPSACAPRSTTNSASKPATTCTTTRQHERPSIPHAEPDLVLAGVEAKPLRGGLRPALTPTPGQPTNAASGNPVNNRTTRLKSLRFQGIANPQAKALA
nr:IS3 family transposase [Kribbella capetownensis]